MCSYYAESQHKEAAEVFVMTEIDPDDDPLLC